MKPKLISNDFCRWELRNWLFLFCFFFPHRSALFYECRFLFLFLNFSFCPLQTSHILYCTVLFGGKRANGTSLYAQQREPHINWKCWRLHTAWQAVTQQRPTPAPSQSFRYFGILLDKYFHTRIELYLSHGSSLHGNKRCEHLHWCYKGRKKKAVSNSNSSKVHRVSFDLVDRPFHMQANVRFSPQRSWKFHIMTTLLFTYSLEL